MTRHHDWQLVAPWYRWPLPPGETRRRGRGTAPVIQKYDDSKLIDAFLADPQHSLVFTNAEDHVYRVASVAPVLIGGTGPLKDYRRSLATTVRVDTEIRKLYLATHKRFYLVVFDLRCNAPGFPMADRDDVCEAGLVVRRRLIDYPPSRRPEAQEILKRIAGLQAALAKLDHPTAKSRRAKRVLRSPNGTAPLTTHQQRVALLEAIEHERQQLRKWSKLKGTEVISEGWIPSATDGIGAWQPVQDEPELIVEHVTTMHPLIPDPRERRHSGRYGTLYFGLLPTASSDHDVQGRARFDDEALYDVRCFVRRHREPCPKSNDPDDCGGQLFWSRPTEAYRLAPPFDAEGTSHRPITIKLPDLKDLAAQAIAKPLGSLSPVKMESPPESTLLFNTVLGLPVAQGLGTLTCFWSIPLITIVALFLLNLIMPIVMLLFGLFWMLSLKFCLGGSPTVVLSSEILNNLSKLDDGLPDAKINALRDELKVNADKQSGTPQSGPKASQRLDSEMIGSTAIATFQKQFLTANLPSKGADPVAGIAWMPHVEPDPELVEALA